MEKRTCYDCAYCHFDLNAWVGSFGVFMPSRPMCANHPDHRGQLAPVPPDGVCRNFRAKPTPPLRVQPPEPPNDEIAYIPLTRGLFATVDAADYPRLSRYKWYALKAGKGENYYACRSSGRRAILMHREIMRPPEGMVVDHIDGNGVNDRRCNMRVCTPLQNSQNAGYTAGKSRFRGVSPSGDRWQAHVRHNGRRHFVGRFDDEVEAAKARDRKALELAGEFAYLNFPELREEG